MAYADTTPRSVVEGWGRDKVLLAADVLEGDLIGADASQEYVLAKAAATAVLAMYIAGQDGDDGDTITVFRMAVVEAEFDAAAAEVTTALYLSDTAGDTGLVAGATAQAVGWVSSTNRILLTPRNPLALSATDILDDSINSQHYAAGSIDTEHIAADQIDSTLIADDAVDSEHYTDGSVDEEHLAAFAAVGGLNALRVATARYDFATDGGEMEAKGLGVTIPDNAVIIGGLLDVVAGLTTGDSATGALHVEGANDLVSATIVSGGPWEAIELEVIVPVFTAATAIKTTAAREITFTIGTGTVTAGTFYVILLYCVTA